MERSVKNSRLGAVISGVFVLAALMLLLCVCGYCYPALQEECREIIGGMETGSVRRAFGVLADGLQNGDAIRETFAHTVEVLFS